MKASRMNRSTAPSNGLQAIHSRHLCQTRHHSSRRTTDRVWQAPMDLRHLLLLPPPIPKDHPGSHSTISHHQQRHPGTAVRSPHHQPTDASTHSPQPTSGLTPTTRRTRSTYVHPGPHHHAYSPPRSQDPYNTIREEPQKSPISNCSYQLPLRCIHH